MKRGYKYKKKGKRKEMINEPHKKMHKCEIYASLSATISLLALKE